MGSSQLRDVGIGPGVQVANSETRKSNRGSFPAVRVSEGCCEADHAAAGRADGVA